MRSSLDVALATSLKGLADRRAGEIPEAFDPPLKEAPPTLTIGLATYDDFDGAYFTVASALTHHPEVIDRCEIIILDNHPEGPAGPALRQFAQESAPANVRYLPYTDVRSTAVRDAIFRFARTPWVLVVDSHVLLAPGSLAALLDRIDADPESADMLTGPIVRQNGTVAATHMEPRFGGSMFGTWGTDERINEPDPQPFEIPMHGLALFAMARERWPGLHPRFTSFGGEEGYLHEKVRHAGGVTVCLPGLRWHHRFLRPAGVPYPIEFDHLVKNYLIGWREIGRDTAEVHRSLSEAVGDVAYDAARRRAERRIDHPSHMFDGVVVASDDDRVAPWRRALQRADHQDMPVHRVAASRHAGGEQGWWPRCVALAGELAVRRGWRSVLVLDEGIAWPASVLYALRQQLAAHRSPVRLTIGDRVVGIAVGPTLATTPAELVEHLTAAEPARWQIDDLLVPDVVDPEQIAAGWTVNAATESGHWERVYPRWAAIGMGSTMHRHPALIEVPEPLQEAFGFAAALRKAEGLTTPVVVSQDRAILSEDAGSVLAAALRELEGVEWEVASLSTGVEAPTEDPWHRRPTTEPDPLVLLVHPDARTELAAELPPPELGELEAWRSWLAESGGLGPWLAARAWRTQPMAVWPQLAARRGLPMSERPEFAGRMGP